MQVTNQLVATPEQAADFFASVDDGPMCMVNLLKFRETALYPDGSEPHLSGREAYMRYARGVKACLETVGGKVRFSALITELQLGSVEDLWDMVAIAEYPSRAAMLEMLRLPEYQLVAKHRAAGLAGQLNIRTKAIHQAGD